MSEPNRNNRTIKEIITDSTNRELEDYETGLMTPEKLRGLVAADNRKKKLRYRKIAGLAALFLVVIVSAVMVFNSVTADVDADKNRKEEIITDDGVVIEDGGWGSSGESDWVITEWSEVKAAKVTIPELVIPEYIPDGYVFDKLEIKEMNNAIKAEYTFVNDSVTQMLIHQYIHDEKLDATQMYENDRRIDSENGVIYIREEPKINKATIQRDDGIIVEIWSTFSDSDIVKILGNMSY